MIRRGLAGVVCTTDFFRDHRVGTRSQNDVSLQALLPEDLVRLVSNDVCAFHIDTECEIPHLVFDRSGLVGRNEYSSSYNDRVNPAIGENHILEHLRDRTAIRHIATKSY